MWPDSWRGQDFYVHCFFHDLEYWCGGDEVDRLMADVKLMVGIARDGNIRMGEVMFAGLRVGGKRHWDMRESAWKEDNDK